MFLECSGQHRGLGVHISFVRSVSMDSWSEKQIKMMQLGGNAALIKFFKEHGVNELSIREKYHTPAAELYRERLLALRDGRDPPTMLSSPMLKTTSGSMGSPMATPPSSASGAAESPYEREMRLRREAEARLREKFGTGGLKGQAVSNSGGFGYVPDEPEPADFKNVGAMFSKLSTAVVSGARELGKKVQDAQLGQVIGEKLSTVGAKLSDPALADKASNMFQSAAAGATGLWSRATAALEGRPAHSGYKSYGGYGREDVTEGVDGSPAPRAAELGRAGSSSKGFSSPAPAPAVDGWGEDWEDSSSASKAKPPRSSVSKTAAALNSSAPAAEDEDFGEWSSFSGSAGDAKAATPVRSGSNSGTPNVSPRPSATASPAPIVAPKSVSISASSSPGLARQKSGGTPGGNGTPTPVVKSDDFFASFGVATAAK